MARFNKPNFASQDEELKAATIKNTSEGFVYNASPLPTRCIRKQLANQFKSHKHASHVIFQCYDTKEMALKNRLDDVKEEDWTFLCNHFDDAKYKEMCLRNAENSEKIKALSTVGTKFIARIIDEQNYKLHYCKKG